MTVLLINNEFKYETEAVIKLFFPVRRFGFVNMTTAPSSYPDGDFALLELRHSSVFSVVRIGERTLEKQMTLESDFSDSDAERAICRLLFLSLRELTGIYPRWGMLTGVRPVKLIYRLRAQGLSNGEISRFLAEQYYVSEEKSRDRRRPIRGAQKPSEARRVALCVDSVLPVAVLLLLVCVADGGAVRAADARLCAAALRRA